MQFLVLATFLGLLLQNIPAQKDGYPSISPNGAYIAFISTRSGGEEIFVVSPDGSHQKQLTNNKEKKNAPKKRGANELPELPIDPMISPDATRSPAFTSTLPGCMWA